jgi:LEA14-like dessication related protein
MAARRLLPAIILLAALTGCASLARSTFAAPKVVLKDVRLKGVGLSGGSLDVILEVDNPNDYRLDATRFTYNFYVDTLKLAYGEVQKRVTLEAHRTAEVVVPLQFSFQQMMQASALITQSGSVDYHVTGEVTAATIAGSITRPYKSDGRFDSLRP